MASQCIYKTAPASAFYRCNGGGQKHFVKKGKNFPRCNCGKCAGCWEWLADDNMNPEEVIEVLFCLGFYDIENPEKTSLGILRLDYSPKEGEYINIRNEDNVGWNCRIVRVDKDFVYHGKKNIYIAVKTEYPGCLSNDKPVYTAGLVSE